MKHSLRFLFPLVAILALLPGCKHSVNQSQVQLPPSAPVSKGQEIFLAHCVSCHQGPGNPPGPNAVILDSETLKTLKDFKALVRQPRASGMTVFTPDILPDKDVKTLYDYLLTAKNPQAAKSP
jgi:mono/diheme cytochrome c family protein